MVDQEESITKPELQLQTRVNQPPGYSGGVIGGQQQTGAVPQPPTVDTITQTLNETWQTLQEADKILSERYNALTGHSANLLNTAVNEIAKDADNSIAGLVAQVRRAAARLHLLVGKF